MACSYFYGVRQGCDPCEFGLFSVTVVLILSVLWKRRLRGLWKLPDGRDWLKVKLDLILMGGPMLNRSLIQFSVDRSICVPSLLFTCGQTMVEVMKIMATTLQRSHSRAATLSTLDAAAGHSRLMPLPLSLVLPCQWVHFQFVLSTPLFLVFVPSSSSLPFHGHKNLATMTFGTYSL